ncbi:MAG TPA: CotH kinase family protein [Spirochaetota bacterium]|nr:CotH kinase family protein [Spirochaetota bacterium]HPJ42204.1 CotH kinase family protein [Spirochaetota bacterium]HPR37859.1 CotH kinase family protein [Spirochaetota bacterium]HRX48959.1 CotH kinase family protein [Spirochaetota bacterium]
MKKNLLLIIIFIAIAICGSFLESAGIFDTAIKRLRDRDLPSPLLNFGRRGQIMKEMGLRYVVPLDEPVRDNGASRISLDLSKLESRDEWIESGNLTPDKMVSTTILDKAIVESGLPIISMYINEHDLYDKFTGIYANPLERGRNWERPCFISCFNDGKLLFGTGAGVRIHGGTSRLHPLKSFRLYFRSVYGQEQFKKGDLFNGAGDPVRRIVVRKADASFGFINSMAYDIARKIGCYAPMTEQVKLYLNGKPHGHGNFEIIEHLSRDYLENHFGHKDFVYYKIKGRKNRPPEYQQLYEWAKDSSQPVIFDNVLSVIDMENFINYWIANIFCANSDPYQGIALLDRKKKGTKWFWLMWDMDHSFVNYYEPDKKNLWEQERPLNLVFSDTKRETDPRYFIFRKLIFNDEKFRSLFKKRLEEKFNYFLTRDYLMSVVDKNSRVCGSLGMNMDKIDPLLYEYMNNRPEYVMNMMNRFFKLGDVKRVNFIIPSGRTIRIDGFEIKKSFIGLYFQGSSLSLSGENSAVRGWIINGRKFYGNRLPLPINENTQVSPLY